jgi:outer membrane protein TolC
VQLDGDPEVATAGESSEPLAEHLQVAAALRPDLSEARLRHQQGELEVVRTRNGLLPRLELFATLGRTGYAQSFSDTIEDDRSHTVEGSLGLRFEYVLGNRSAEAAHRISQSTAEEQSLSLENQRRQVEFDIHLAWSELARAGSQRLASAARVTAEEENLRSVTASADVGRKSPYLVALAQRDLLQARLDAARDTVAIRTAYTALYRQDGSLLQRRGIVERGAPAQLER